MGDICSSKANRKKITIQRQPATICLDEYVKQKKQDRIDKWNALLMHSPAEICLIIMEYCWTEDEEDHILIPNTFDNQRFWTYWTHPVENNAKTEYKDVHQVAVCGETSMILYRRGAIVSKIGYKASSNAKLMIECQFNFNNSTDFMTLTTRSDGKRSNGPWAKWGIVDGYCICQMDWVVILVKQ